MASRMSLSMRCITGVPAPSRLNSLTHAIRQVHERSIDSDFLLIILRRLMQRRKDLRVLLMSATVDAEKVCAIYRPRHILHTK